MIVWVEQRRGVCLAAQMALPNALQVHIHQRVTVEHQEVLGERTVARQHRSGRPQWFFLDDVRNLHTPFVAVSEMALNQLGAVAGKDDDLVKAVLPGQLDLMLQQRSAANGNHRFGQITQTFAQALAHSPRQNQKLLHRLSRMANSTASFELSLGDQPSACSFSLE